MSAAVHPGSDAPLDRRALLRAGLLGAGVLALATSQPDIAGLVGVGRAGRPIDSRGVGGLPDAAAWELLIGHEVVLTATAGTRTTAQLVDVRDVAHPSPHVDLRGEAYSVMFDAPSLPPASMVTVAVDHADLAVPALVLLPVNGDGSWEAVVDGRLPATSR